MKIKVCGMRDASNIRAVCRLPIDMMGFIFWQGSKRYVSMISSMTGSMPDYSAERLRIATAAHDGAPLASAHKIQRVGVFVDDMPQNIITRVYNYDLDYVQLHGDELPVMIDNLRRTVVPDLRQELKIIKTIGIASADDLKRCEPYYGHVDLFLFDTKCDGRGGSGRQFAWDLLRQYDGHVPFILSGGIGPDDVDRVKAFSHPMFYGIDLNSRFEVEPGVKDVRKLESFINALR